MRTMKLSSVKSGLARCDAAFGECVGNIGNILLAQGNPNLLARIFKTRGRNGTRLWCQAGAFMAH